MPAPKKEPGARLNWTKIGLKPPAGVAESAYVPRLNWTKIGLKLEIDDDGDRLVTLV